jgi:DNA mismatch endonuclease (patch repair protein)
MADVFTREVRSKVMSSIRSNDTSIELSLRKAIYSLGLRGYRVHSSILGHPDILFKKNKVVVFIDGDFCHGYNWKIKGKVPPRRYWQAKITRNIMRDKIVTESLTRIGWNVLRFWEHDVRQDTYGCAMRIFNAVKKPLSTFNKYS